MSALPAIGRAKLRVLAHNLAALRQESPLKVLVVGFATLGLWVGAFQISLAAFQWLVILGGDALGPVELRLGTLIAGRLLSSLALVLFALLAVSNLLVVYATLFRAAETGFLLRAPLGARSLFLVRCAEATLLASWGSAFLGSPLLLAYGVATVAPPFFYLALVFVYPAFALLPAALGALGALLVARFLPRPGWWTVVAGGLALLAMLAFLRTRLRGLLGGVGASFESLLALLRQSESPWLPSQWAVEAVVAAAAGDVARACLWLGLLVVAAGLAVALATELARVVFFPAWSRLQASPETPRRGRPAQLLERLVSVLPEPSRSLWLKDVKLFARDPAQWSQFALFFGVMGLYGANLHRARPVYEPELWQSLLTLLNSTVSLLVLATLTTRFVFPLISLEGRRAWILRLAPVTWRQVQRQKFLLGVVSTALFTVGLAALAAWRLELSAEATLLSLAAVAVSTWALSGLAVGLGSLFPNFREDNPSRIVSGTGGTLNFILSLLFVAVVGVVETVVLRWRWLDERFALALPDHLVLPLALGLLVGLGALTAWLPLRLGLAHLERLEL